MKKLILKILSITAVVAVIISISIIPVSAGSNSYYDSGTVYVSDFIKRDGFKLVNQYQISGASFLDNGDCFRWEAGQLIFPDLYTWENYSLHIPVDTVTVEVGDVYYFDLYFVFETTCPLWVKSFTAYKYDSDGNNLAESLTSKVTVSPQPTASVDGWMSYGSLQKHSLHFRVELSASSVATFDRISFNFQLYKSRTDSSYFNLYDTTTYRLYGGDPTSPNYPQYEDPRDTGLQDDINNYVESEEEVMGSAVEGLDEFGSMFKAFSLYDFQDGMLGIIKIYSVIMPEIPFVKQLIDLSLLIGCWSFLLGFATMSVRHFSGRRARGDGGSKPSAGSSDKE